MFTGIVETTGVIIETHHTADCVNFSLKPQIAFTDIRIGDSIAINGTCLTVTAIQENCFRFTAVPETLRQTNLGTLHTGNTVNIERSMKADGRIGGHYVQGHVDAVGKITHIHPEGDALSVTIAIPSHLAKYIVKKGYIAIDGMSITVIESTNDYFSITLIPHTQLMTIAKDYRLDTLVNLEVDIMGKYIEKLLVGYHA